MENANKPIDLVVTATEGANGDIEWAIDGKRPKDSILEFSRDSGRHDINFKLDDNTKRGLRFNQKDPIWDEKDVTECPQIGAKSSQIEVTSCEPKRLSVNNGNFGDPCVLHYALNFVDSSGDQHSLDPVIKNGGGNIA